METVKVWHFAKETLRDGRPLPKAGEMLKHEGPIVPCESGLHGSVRALDALMFAPGPYVVRAVLSGTIRPHEKDKHVADERTSPTDYVDATVVLHEFACWCATQALDLVESCGQTVDPRSRAAITAKRGWLAGTVTDGQLAAAQDAARDAAGDAAWAAARAAAWDAAWAAARAAAQDAAGEAARDAARAAAWAAARAAAWGAAQDATRAAAWGAAQDAAWDAAWGVQNAKLEEMLTALLEATNGTQTP